MLDFNAEKDEKKRGKTKFQAINKWRKRLENASQANDVNPETLDLLFKQWMKFYFGMGAPIEAGDIVAIASQVITNKNAGFKVIQESLALSRPDSAFIFKALTALVAVLGYELSSAAKEKDTKRLAYLSDVISKFQPFSVSSESESQQVAKNKTAKKVNFKEKTQEYSYTEKYHLEPISTLENGAPAEPGIVYVGFDGPDRIKYTVVPSTGEAPVTDHIGCDEWPDEKLFPSNEARLLSSSRFVLEFASEKGYLTDSADQRDKQAPEENKLSSSSYSSYKKRLISALNSEPFAVPVGEAPNFFSTSNTQQYLVEKVKKLLRYDALGSSIQKMLGASLPWSEKLRLVGAVAAGALKAADFSSQSNEIQNLYKELQCFIAVSSKASISLALTKCCVFLGEIEGGVQNVNIEVQRSILIRQMLLPISKMLIKENSDASSFLQPNSSVFEDPTRVLDEIRKFKNFLNENKVAIRSAVASSESNSTIFRKFFMRWVHFSVKAHVPLNPADLAFIKVPSQIEAVVECREEILAIPKTGFFRQEMRKEYLDSLYECYVSNNCPSVSFNDEFFRWLDLSIAAKEILRPHLRGQEPILRHFISNNYRFTDSLFKKELWDGVDIIEKFLEIFYRENLPFFRQFSLDRINPDMHRIIINRLLNNFIKDSRLEKSELKSLINDKILSQKLIEPINNSLDLLKNILREDRNESESFKNNEENNSSWRLLGDTVESKKSADIAIIFPEVLALIDSTTDQKEAFQNLYAADPVIQRRIVAEWMESNSLLRDEILKQYHDGLALKIFNQNKEIFSQKVIERAIENSARSGNLSQLKMLIINILSDKELINSFEIFKAALIDAIKKLPGTDTAEIFLCALEKAAKKNDYDFLNSLLKVHAVVNEKKKPHSERKYIDNLIMALDAKVADDANFQEMPVFYTEDKISEILSGLVNKPNADKIFSGVKNIKLIFESSLSLKDKLALMFAVEDKARQRRKSNKVEKFYTALKSFSHSLDRQNNLATIEANYTEFITSIGKNPEGYRNLEHYAQRQALLQSASTNEDSFEKNFMRWVQYYQLSGIEVNEKDLSSIKAIPTREELERCKNIVNTMSISAVNKANVFDAAKNNAVTKALENIRIKHFGNLSERLISYSSAGIAEDEKKYIAEQIQTACLGQLSSLKKALESYRGLTQGSKFFPSLAYLPTGMQAVCDLIDQKNSSPRVIDILLTLKKVAQESDARQTLFSGKRDETVNKFYKAVTQFFNDTNNDKTEKNMNDLITCIDNLKEQSSVTPAQKR